MFNLENADQKITTDDFYCTTSSDCVLVHTTACFNNMPSQQACISRNYSATYNASYNTYRSSSGFACAQYYVAGNASCGCVSNQCTLIYTSG